MVIFVNEERAYLSWLAHHRQGFVLDLLTRPTRKQPVLHRAMCAAIKVAPTTRTLNKPFKKTRKKTHWTTGRHVKACSLDIGELQGWAATESDRAPLYCETCKPTDDEHLPTDPQDKHLTRLGKEIMDYVVEAAVVCLDQGVTYDTSAGDVAGYLGKSPAQLTTVLRRLVEGGYLRLEGEVDAQETRFRTTAASFRRRTR